MTHRRDEFFFFSKIHPTKQLLERLLRWYTSSFTDSKSIRRSATESRESPWKRNSPEHLTNDPFSRIDADVSLSLKGGKKEKVSQKKKKKKTVSKVSHNYKRDLSRHRIIIKCTSLLLLLGLSWQPLGTEEIPIATDRTVKSHARSTRKLAKRSGSLFRPKHTPVLSHALAIRTDRIASETERRSLSLTVHHANVFPNRIESERCRSSLNPIGADATLRLRIRE